MQLASANSSRLQACATHRSGRGCHPWAPRGTPAAGRRCEPLHQMFVRQELSLQQARRICINRSGRQGMAFACRVVHSVSVQKQTRATQPCEVNSKPVPAVEVRQDGQNGAGDEVQRHRPFTAPEFTLKQLLVWNRVLGPTFSTQHKPRTRVIDLQILVQRCM